jgi:DNA-binding PadR family transcriptional regulator
MNPLTDLEGMALAQIARRGPVTSYAVSRAFADSPSAFWTGSAGAIYPAMRRLAARKFIRGVDAADGQRARTDYIITARGTTALKAWLLDAGRAADIGFDPLRTRAIYLDLVSEKERKTFMAAVAKQVEINLAETKWPEEAKLGAIHRAVMRARKAWVKALTAIVT